MRQTDTDMLRIKMTAGDFGTPFPIHLEPYCDACGAVLNPNDEIQVVIERSGSTLVIKSTTWAQVQDNGGYYTLILTEADAHKLPPGIYTWCVRILRRGELRYTLLADTLEVTLAATDGGITDNVTARAESLVRLNGEEREVRVSSAGGIFRGDPVVLCREFVPGEAIRFALGGNAKILDTASAPNAGANAICYTQNGQTKLKMFYLQTTLTGEPSLRLGNTVILMEDKAMEQATVCLSQDAKDCYVFYNLNGDGLVKKVSVSSAAGYCHVTGTDIWMDGGNPENITAACGPERIAVCCTRLPEGKTQDDEREAVLLTLRVVTGKAGAGALAIDREAVLAAKEYPALHGLVYDTDGYAHGWSMAAYADTVYLTYPKPNGMGRGVLVATLQEVSYTNITRQEYIPTGYTDCPIQGSVPSAQLSGQSPNTAYGVAGGVTLAHGVTRLNGQGQIESMLAMELWVRQAGDDRPLLLWAGEEDVSYGESISMACSGNMGEKGGFAGYARDKSMMGIAFAFRPDGAVGGPSLTLGTFTGYGVILPGDQTHAAFVYDYAGDGFIKPLRQRSVAIRAAVGNADAIAMVSGKPGDTIQVVQLI